MAELLIGTIAFNVAWAIEEQARTLRAHLRDDYELVVYDNSDNELAADAIREAARGSDLRYVRLDTRDHLHHLALNAAASDLLAHGVPYIGLLDHDVFAARDVEMLSRIDQAGFYGVGQFHAPTEKSYLWPGFIWFSRAFLEGKPPLDFDGIRGGTKSADGDTGSGLWPLYEGQDWTMVHRGGHSYGFLREPDSVGLQSFGYEVLCDQCWIHLTNLSGWKAIPRPEQRDELARALVASL